MACCSGCTGLYILGAVVSPRFLAWKAADSVRFPTGSRCVAERACEGDISGKCGGATQVRKLVPFYYFVPRKWFSVRYE